MKLRGTDVPMDELGSMHAVDRFGHLADQIHAFAVEQRDPECGSSVCKPEPGRYSMTTYRNPLVVRPCSRVCTMCGCFSALAISPSLGFPSPLNRDSKASVFSGSAIFRPTMLPERCRAPCRTWTSCRRWLPATVRIATSTSSFLPPRAENRFQLVKKTHQTTSYTSRSAT